MKKILFSCSLLIAFCLNSCDKEIEDVLSDSSLLEQTEADYQNLSLQTRSDSKSRMQLFVEQGDRVGVFVKYGNQLDGPEFYTVKDVSGIGNQLLTFEETVVFKDPNLAHTFYAYYPFESTQSTDPTRIDVLPVTSVQTQNGTSKDHIDKMEFYVGEPVTINPGQDLKMSLSSVYTELEFRMNTNIAGLKVQKIDFVAPDGEFISFTSGTVDITKAPGQTGFSEIKDMQGGGTKIQLTIDGELEVPNSTTTYSSGYMAISPFDGSSKQMKITVYTNNGEFEFDEDGIYFEPGVASVINLRIEKKGQTLKDIKVLSLCEIGYLGKYDNSKQWTTTYGVDAYSIHSKNMRRILFEHFGKGKTVETGTISFEKQDIMCYLNKMSDSDLDKYDIIFLNHNARPDDAMAKRVMNWLNRSPNRVLMLAYDWKEPCLYPTTSNSLIPYKHATNYIFFKNHIKGVKPHWYNSYLLRNPSIGNYGMYRSCMLVPFELNARTSYFWKDGPFKTTLTESSDQRYWVEDCYWGSAEVTDPNVIPLISYRDARSDIYPNSTHCYGGGDKGMILGVDPEKRIVYVGDSEIFSIECATTTHKKAARITFDQQGNLNNYGKIMGNLWAWMVTEVVQK